MIYIWMKGGLGNQLFQYAFGRYLSEITGQRMVLDLRVFQARQLGGSKAHERFTLDRLCLADCHITSPIHALAARTLNKVMASAPPLRNKAAWITDRTPDAGRTALALQNKIIFADGFFQRSLYPKGARAALLRQFVPRDERNRQSAIALINQYRGEGPVVAVHVRRGDFLDADSPSAALPGEYFHRAMERFPGCTFLVFTDDPVWSRSQFGGSNIHIMPQSDAVQDLYAMSLADHNIISNSTFSWWSAWLNQNDHRRVIAPQIWLNPGLEFMHADDFLPSDWTVLNSLGEDVHRPFLQDGALAPRSSPSAAQNAA